MGNQIPASRRSSAIIIFHSAPPVLRGRQAIAQSLPYRRWRARRLNSSRAVCVCVWERERERKCKRERVSVSQAKGDSPAPAA